MSRLDDARRHAVEQALDHRFADLKLLEQALIHRSTTSGARDFGYERLEFLGDRVLGVVVATMLYHAFETEAEGKLAVRHVDLVRRETIAEIAAQLGIGDHILMSRDAEEIGTRQNATVLSDVMEALIGALYLDGGLEVATSFIERHWGARMLATHKPPRDAKTELQEWALARALPLPAYTMLERTGPDHAPTITVACEVESLGRSTAHGGSRRAAEQIAAEELLRLARGGGHA